MYKPFQLINDKLYGYYDCTPYEIGETICDILSNIYSLRNALKWLKCYPTNLAFAEMEMVGETSYKIVRILTCNDLIIENNKNNELHPSSNEPMEWYKVGVPYLELHREGDLPALVDESIGLRKWYIDGELHRYGDLPAYICEKNNVQRWYQYGELHRDGDLPAVINKSNVISEVYQWYQHDKLHRDGDQPAYIVKHCDIHGDNNDATNDDIIEMSWFKDDILHREGDMPAYIDPKNGIFKWFKKGKLHRDGLPAVIDNTNGTRQWYCEDVLVGADGLQVPKDGNNDNPFRLDCYQSLNIEQTQSAYNLKNYVVSGLFCLSVVLIFANNN